MVETETGVISKCSRKGVDEVEVETGVSCKIPQMAERGFQLAAVHQTIAFSPPTRVYRAPAS